MASSKKPVAKRSRENKNILVNGLAGMLGNLKASNSKKKENKSSPPSKKAKSSPPPRKSSRTSKPTQAGAQYRKEVTKKHAKDKQRKKNEASRKNVIKAMDNYLHNMMKTMSIAPKK